MVACRARNTIHTVANGLKENVYIEINSLLFVSLHPHTKKKVVYFVCEITMQYNLYNPMNQNH